MRRWSLAALFPLTVAARAAPLPPACDPAQDGAQLCVGHQVCACAYDQGGLLTGRRPGWRWSCDILRACATDAPADSFPPAIAPGQVIVAPSLDLPANPAAPAVATPPLRRRR